MPGRNIFICYRRDDAEGYAGRIFDRLNSRFPRRVFMDVMAIRPGADFTRVIQDTVGSCGVLVAIIGRHWLTITDESSRRRIDQPDDYVRHEIASALNRNVMVIPVLVRDAKMPKPELLPPDLTLLAKRNALEITDTDFDHDIQRLITAIEDQLGERRPVVPLLTKVEHVTKYLPDCGNCWSGLGSDRWLCNFAWTYHSVPRSGRYANSQSIIQRRLLPSLLRCRQRLQLVSSPSQRPLTLQAIGIL